MKILLNILASDILESNYFNSETCPITKAFHRAGYPHLEDWGCTIENVSLGKKVYTYSEEDTKHLHLPLLNMYKTKNPQYNAFLIIDGQRVEMTSIPIEDFTYEIELPI